MADKLNILYFADQWDNKWRRRQQIAVQLVKQTDILSLYYIESPLSLTSFIKYIFGKADNEANTRWKRVFKKGFSFTSHGINIITPFSLLPFLGACAHTGINWMVVICSIRCHLSSYYKPDIFWATLPYNVLFMDKFVTSKVVYDCSEKFTDFVQWESIVDKIKLWDGNITQKANVLFVQTQEMLKYKKDFNEKTFLVENGCDYDVFVSNKKVPLRLKSIKRPIIGYSGSINERINYKMVDEIAVLKPDWSFVFVGSANRKEPIIRDNVYFLGEVPYDEMARYVNNFDVCMMPHHTKGVSESQSPLKLFDYLSSGNPIVSTSIQGIKGYDDLLIIADDADGMVTAIEMGLKDNDSDKRIKRVFAAQKCTWDIRFLKMWGYLKKYVIT